MSATAGRRDGEGRVGRSSARLLLAPLSSSGPQTRHGCSVRTYYDCRPAWAHAPGRPSFQGTVRSARNGHRQRWRRQPCPTVSQRRRDCYALSAPMADIFLSYAHEDRAAAERVALALEQRGYDVWWDPDIPAGPSYTQVIEHALTSAKCVVVLWSAASVASSWVQDEAREGQERGVLVATRLAIVKPPLGFRGHQLADLAAWDGGADDQGVPAPSARHRGACAATGPAYTEAPAITAAACARRARAPRFGRGRRAGHGGPDARGQPPE